MMARNTDVIPLSITHLLIDAVEDGDLEAVADIVAVHGFDETERVAHYNVTIVVDYGQLSTVVCVPYRDDDDPAHDTDDTAVDLAVALWRDQYGFDLSRIRARDVSVELQGVTE